MMMSRKPEGEKQITEMKVVKKMSKDIIDAIASGDWTPWCRITI